MVGSVKIGPPVAIRSDHRRRPGRRRPDPKPSNGPWFQRAPLVQSGARIRPPRRREAPLSSVYDRGPSTNVDIYVPHLFDLEPPRHTSTLHISAVRCGASIRSESGTVRSCGGRYISGAI